MNEETEQQVRAIATEIASAEHEAAPVRSEMEPDRRVDDMERRIRDLEAAIGDLRTVTASAAAVATGRKTQASYAPRLLVKGAEPVKAGSVDAALRSLTVEQRMAVKAGLLRAGLL